MPFVLFLVLLMMLLIQGALPGLSLVLVWVISIAVSLQQRKVIVWSFVAGLINDLVVGGKLGTHSLFYLSLAAAIYFLQQVFPRKSFVTISVFVIVAVLVERLIFEQRVTILGLVVSIAVFWLIVPVAMRVDGSEAGGLKLKMKA